MHPPLVSCQTNLDFNADRCLQSWTFHADFLTISIELIAYCIVLRDLETNKLQYKSNINYCLIFLGLNFLKELVMI